MDCLGEGISELLREGGQDLARNIPEGMSVSPQQADSIQRLQRQTGQGEHPLVKHINVH